MAVVGSTMLLFIILFVSVGAVFYSEADSNFNDTSRKLEAPSWEHPFGTDTIGRDILARTIYGGQISLLPPAHAIAGPDRAAGSSRSARRAQQLPSRQRRLDGRSPGAAGALAG
jgi:hypothetical protein